MNWPTINTILRAAGCTLVVLGGGCQTAWQGGADVAAKRPAASSSSPADRPVDPEDPDAVDQQALAAAMDQVQQLGASDPAAQQKLLDELRRSKPALWPLVVEQFRASLAYHKELTTGRAAADGPGAGPMEPVWPSSELRPSAEVGSLVDPRSVRPDATTEQTIATATPANMPPPLDADAAIMTATSVYAPRPMADDVLADPIHAAVDPPIDTLARGRSSATSGNPSEIALASHTALPQRYDDSAASATAGRDPQDDGATLGWQRHVALAIDDLEGRASDAPQSTAEVHQQVSLRLLELVSGDTEAALQPIPKLTAEEQDFWSDQIFALATLLDHHAQPDDKRRAAATAIHLDEAVGHLREMSSLSVRNLAFCKRVYDFGAYDPFLEPRFSPGEQVTLYVEVENYHSESTEEGYSTSLGSSYVLLDHEGERVGGGEFPAVDDCCRSRRRDFHIQYGLALPTGLLPGEYRLDLTIRDQQSDKRGHGSIAFEIRER